MLSKWSLLYTTNIKNIIAHMDTVNNLDFQKQASDMKY